MLVKAHKKLSYLAGTGHNFKHSLIKGNIRQPGIFQTEGPWDIATAQRVFSGTKAAFHHDLLLRWKSLLSPHGILIVDLPHPDRIISTLWAEDTTADSPVRCCWRICDDDVFQEIRERARVFADKPDPCLLVRLSRNRKGRTVGLTQTCPASYKFDSERGKIQGRCGANHFRFIRLLQACCRISRADKYKWI